MKDKIVKIKTLEKNFDENSNENEQDDRLELPCELVEVFMYAKQVSEWGNGCLTNVFRILKRIIKIKNIEMGRIFWVCMLMNNWRIEIMENNQIGIHFENIKKKMTNKKEKIK